MAKASKITIDCGNPLVIHDDVSLHHVYSNHQIIVASLQVTNYSQQVLDAWRGKTGAPTAEFWAIWTLEKGPWQLWESHSNIWTKHSKLFSQQIIFTISTKHSNTEQNELNYLNSDLSWPISWCVALLMLLPPHWGRWRPNVSTDVRKKFELQYLVLAQLHH